MSIVKNICNFGRYPMGYDNNPLNLTAIQLIEHKIDSNQDTSLYEYHLNRQIEPKLSDIFGNVDVLKEYKFSSKFHPWTDELPAVCSDNSDNIFSHDYVNIRYLNFYVEDSIKRIGTLIDSIDKNGYDSDRFDSSGILVDLLISDDQKKLYIVDGHHRVAALNALGLSFDVKVCGTFNSVDEWASVKGKFLSKNDALKILNQYMGT